MAKKDKQKPATEAPESGAESEEGADGEQPKKKGGIMKLALFIGLPVVILALGGVAAMLLLGGGGGDETHVAEAGEHGEVADGHGGSGGRGSGGGAAEHAYFYEIPQMQITIQNGSGGFAHVQITFSLEIPDEDMAHDLDENLPRILDQFQGFLRELRPEDLAGSAGAERLRLELLRRVNLVMGEGQVRAVLITQFVIA
jgi:flagellar FliL protein